MEIEISIRAKRKKDLIEELKWFIELIEGKQIEKGEGAGTLSKEMDSDLKVK